MTGSGTLIDPLGGQARQRRSGRPAWGWRQMGPKPPMVSPMTHISPTGLRTPHKVPKHTAVQRREADPKGCLTAWSKAAIVTEVRR